MNTHNRSRVAFAAAVLAVLVSPLAAGASPLAIAGARVAPLQVAFGKQRIGTAGVPSSVTITNTLPVPLEVDDVTIEGTDPYDFFGATTCFPGHVRPRMLPAGASCTATVRFGPLAYGARRAKLHVRARGTAITDVVLGGTGTDGYFIAGMRGEVAARGDARRHGDLTARDLAAPVVAITATRTGAGYWLLTADGAIAAFGDARSFGSMAGRALNRPIVGMAATADDGGYWLVASDGGVFAFGDARFMGSTGTRSLNAPIVAMSAAPDGRGYWLLAADGGVFAFGGARFAGSSTVAHIAPFVRIRSAPSGAGYWLLAADGRLLGFGDAVVYGSAVGEAVVDLAPTADGRGYWEVTRSGRVVAYGDAHAHGGVGVTVDDVVGIAATAPPLPGAIRGSAVRRVAAA